MTAVRVLAGKARAPLDWGCERCGRDDRSALAGQSDAARRKLRNCDGESNAGFAVEGHARLRRCPWSQIEARDVLAVERWSRWKTLGVWPYAGSAAEQPALVVDEIEACEAAFTELVEEQRPAPADGSSKKKR